MSDQDLPPPIKLKLSTASAGSAVEDLKIWLTEIGVDSSNLEELIILDNENYRNTKCDR